MAGKYRPNLQRGTMEWSTAEVDPPLKVRCFHGGGSASCRLESAKEESLHLQFAPPVPTPVGPAKRASGAKGMQVEPSRQARCDGSPVDDGVAQKVARSHCIPNGESWGVSNDTAAIENDFNAQLVHIQSQLSCILAWQESMHAVVAKLSVDFESSFKPNSKCSQREAKSSVSQARFRHRDFGVPPYRRRSSTARSSTPVSSQAKRFSHDCHVASSRNLFADKNATEADDMLMLRDLFLEAETSDRKMIKCESFPDEAEYDRSGLRNTDQQTIDGMFEPFFGVVICLNAIFIGISMDHSDDAEPLWIAIDACFSALFFLELCVKLWFNGFCMLFCGSKSIWRIFDGGLVFFDFIQLLLLVTLRDVSATGLRPSATLFRMVRLGKLARVVRLLKFSVFNDLLAMLHGMFGGMATLGWALVLFLAFIYVVSIIFREYFGKNDVPIVSELFNSVPRAMFTTFRCSFGDCTGPSGVPIFEHVAKEYGVFSAFSYCLFVFVVTIGLFNVISAIFVDSTMAATSAMKLQSKKSRLRDHTRWCCNVHKLVKRLLEISCMQAATEGTKDARLSQVVSEVANLEVPCSDIDMLVQDPEAISALDALDIVPEDRDYLSDILDPDCGGTVNVVELIEGLRRLRGDPRRSDTVTLQLMTRSVHKDVVDMLESLSDIRRSLHNQRSS